MPQQPHALPPLILAGCAHAQELQGLRACACSRRASETHAGAGLFTPCTTHSARSHTWLQRVQVADARGELEEARALQILNHLVGLHIAAQATGLAGNVL